MLERFFKFNANDTSLKVETLAGCTTFLTMSYIIFVNPQILSQAGMDAGAVFVATCIAAALGSAMMGLFANYPIALAPGMALNSYFTYGVVLGSGYPWQTALGAVFISGVLFFALSISPLREYIIDSIPKSLKLATVAGVGLFLGIIGFKNAGIIVANKETLLTLGNMHAPTTLLAILGFVIIVSLDGLGIVAGIIISILGITFLGMALGLSEFKGIFSLPPSIMPTLLQLDIKGAFQVGLITIVFAFLLVDFFDNTGTLMGVAHRAGFMNKDGKLPRIKQALLADSFAAISSALLGTSTTTNYLESTVGVKVGGRTGFTAMVVAILFLLALFFAPLAESVPAYATAPALIYIACLMTRAFTEFDWEDITESAPAVLTAIAMPLTFSIAVGLSFGLVSYTAIKILTGRYKELNLTMVVLSLIFVGKYAYIG